MTEIFVSYRRQDSKAYAGWVCDLLVQHLGPGKIFRDIDGIPPGEDFGKVIGDRLADCKIFLALIGPRWLKSRSGLRRRLFQPNDFVRLEVFIALNRPIVVIPVLVEGARMPSARSLPKAIVDLTNRNAFTILESRVHAEVAELAEMVKKNLAKALTLDDKALQAERERVQGLISADLQERRRRRRRVVIAACWAAAIMAAGVITWAVRHFIPIPGGTDIPQSVSQTLGRPQFGHPDPDATKFRVPHESDTVAYERLAHSTPDRMPRPFPPSRGGTEPILKLEDILGVKNEPTPMKIMFQAAGSTGNVKSPAIPNMIAEAMRRDFDQPASQPKPSFFLDLGDVIYSFGEAKYYYDQFYLPYRQYPAPILAIAGNHDGIIAPGATTPTLQAFLSNFCADRFRLGVEDTLGRTPQIQPGVYFTFEAPFVRILVLYSNTLEGPGVISDQGGQFPQVGQAQIRFLEAALTRIKNEHFAGAVIIAVHHDPYSPNSRNTSQRMRMDLDAISRRVGVWPHAVLSGHAHNYQLYKRTIEGIEIPYVVAGNGGFANLLQMRGVPSKLPWKLPLDRDDVRLIGYDDQHFGYLRITVDDKRLHIEYQPVSGDTAAVGGVYEVTVDLKSHRLVS